MNITFVDTQVFKLNLEKNHLSDYAGNTEDSFSFTPIFSDEKSDEFLIVFRLLLNCDEFVISTEFAARFIADGEINDEFKTSNFVKINAPAIAYPFLRAFISNLTINSGLTPIVLPTMNFLKGFSCNETVK